MRLLHVFGFDANPDQLDLRSFAAGHDGDWVLAHAHEIKGNVVSDFGDRHVTLMDQSVGSLHEPSLTPRRWRLRR